MHRYLLQAGIFLATLARVSWAGNDEGVPVGNEASVLAAAITASTRDGSAGYYNPAGLAHIDRASLDVTADVYGFRVVRTTNALASANHSADARGIDWILVPSAATYTRRFGKFVGSFGIFVPRTTDVLQRTELEDDVGEDWIASTRQESHDSFYTLSVGWHAKPNLRIGISALGVYTSEVIGYQLSGGEPGENTNFFTYSTLANQSEYGLAIMGGVQWDINEKLTFGMSLRSPSMTLFRISEQSDSISVQAAGQPAAFQQSNSKSRGFDADLTTPFKFRGGLEWRVAPKWTLLFDGDMTPPLNRLVLTDRKWLFNLRVAAKYEHTKKMAFGAGLFTDRSPEVERPIHFYGLTVGAIFKHDLDQKDDSPITLGTTIAGRYAYGAGRVDGILVPDLNTSTDLQLIEGRTSAHELSAVLGGSVYF